MIGRVVYGVSERCETVEWMSWVPEMEMNLSCCGCVYAYIQAAICIPHLATFIHSTAVKPEWRKWLSLSRPILNPVWTLVDTHPYLAMTSIVLRPDLMIAFLVPCLVQCF